MPAPAGTAPGRVYNPGRVSPSSSTFLRRLAGGVVAGLLILVVFGAGVLVGGHPRMFGITDLPPALRDAILGETDTSVSTEVLQILQDGYYREVDTERLDNLGVDALLAGLRDPYTVYLDPEEYAALLRDTEGVFFGVGMTVRQDGPRLVVTGLYPGAPAQRAGVRPGDVIVGVDGRDVRGRPLGDVVSRIRGPENTAVTVAFLRGRERRTVRLVRARIKTQPVTSRMERLGDTPIGYVRLAAFDRGAGGAVRNAVRGLAGDGARAIVFDLRGDSGGLVDEAVTVAGAFLPAGSEVVTIEGLNQSRRTLRTGDAPAARLPVVVLMDRGSASASEIVAGALRDEGGIPLVGTRSFGKALVQTTRPLRNGGALKYTSARYLTPAGVDISRRGLRPDVRAEDDPDTAAVDEGLRAALRAAAGRT